MGAWTTDQRETKWQRIFPFWSWMFRSSVRLTIGSENSEKRINKRCECGSPGEDQKRTDQQKNDNGRQQPPLLANFHEHPEFPYEFSMGHFPPSKLPFQISPAVMLGIQTRPVSINSR